MPQRIFRIVRILGLFVAAALLALWIRGRFIYDVAIFTTPRHVYCEICIIADQIRFTTVSRWPGDVPLHWRHDHTAYGGFAIGQRAVYRNWFPFGISMTSGGTFAVSEPFAPAINRQKPLRVRYQLIAIPIPLLILLAVLPAAGSMLVSRWRKRRFVRRQESGLCPACGYDLRGMNGRCPECGVTPAARAMPVPVVNRIQIRLCGDVARPREGSAHRRPRA